MKVRCFFAWYDLWIGAYWNRAQYVLYLCPLPCVVIAVDFSRVSYRYTIEEDGYTHTGFGHTEAEAKKNAEHMVEVVREEMEEDNG